MRNCLLTVAAVLFFSACALADSAHILNPVWSPDGRWIAFERRTPTQDVEIRLIDANGRRGRLLYRFAHRRVFRQIDILGWSRDGQTVRVSESLHVNDAPRTALWLMPVGRTGAAHRWARGYVARGFIPGVSGERVCLACDGSFTVAPGAGGYVRSTRLEITDMCGKTLHTLHCPDSYAHLDAARWHSYEFADNSALSPDGRWVMTPHGFALTFEGLVAYSVDGRIVRQLKDRAENDGPKDSRWSAGRAIVIIRKERFTELSLWNLIDGTRPICGRLDSEVDGLAVSPDGRAVCFSRYGQNTLCIAPLAGTPVKIVALPGRGEVSIGPYAWTDAGIIATVTTRSGRSNLFRLSNDGRRSRLLASY